MAQNSRYRIIYGKTQPMATWATGEAAAWKKAEMLERAGYSVQVWKINPDGSVNIHPESKE
nr:MAG TPA: hypothetical protein [Caudoviricetes sp.]